MLKIIGIVGFAIVMTGCATTPPPMSETKLAPKDRVLSYQDKTEAASAKLIVTRDVGFIAGGCYLGLSINNVLSARLGTAETASFFVEPGELLLRVGVDPMGKGLCSVGKDVWTQRETILRVGETKMFRMTIDANGKTDILRSD
ncbi:hypothetical protein [Collimonas pratensis]|uniref:hypothetical protein n=1 Tax=Collimonas pratensis TaxID=279113 RepID=UPI0012E7D28D|nr:hypothetical protein [Collimonas pratensis]